MRFFFDTYLQELSSCVRDLGVIVFFLLVPIGYPILYAYIYSGEVVRNIPIAAVDLSNSSNSRTYLQRTDASPELSIQYHCTDMLQARKLMAQEKIRGIIFIPPQFDENLNNNRQAHISIYCNMASLFYYKALLSVCTEVSLDMNKDIQIKRISALSAQQADAYTSPLAFEAVGLSNPSAGFANFIIPAILVLIIQQTLLLGVGVRMGTEHEKRASQTNWTLTTLIARSAAYITIYIPVSAFLLCFIPAIFGLYRLSHPLTLSLFMIPYLISCSHLAISIGSLIRQRESPMLIFVFTSVPLLFLSGISWPGSSIPLFWKIFSYIFPSTAAINGFVRINGSGATLSDVAFEYSTLWIQAIIYFVVSMIATKVYRNFRMVKR